jgi:splicing factor 3B subunit 3
VPLSSHLLISVPGGKEGPSGVIVCAENELIYKRINHKDISCVIPRRVRIDNDYSKGMMIISFSTIKRKSTIFFLIQNEEGDLFKVQLELDKNKNVTNIICQYFDTVPISNSFCVLLKTGCMFLASEFANQYFYLLNFSIFYRFTSLGKIKIKTRE